MLRLIRSTSTEQRAPSATVARARLQRALGADRRHVAHDLALPAARPPLTPADDLLGRLLGEPPAGEGGRQ